MLTGAYQYAYAFRNSATGEIGPLSPLSTSLTVASKQIDISAVPVFNDFRRMIYRTVAGGTEMLYLTQLGFTGTTYTDNVPDADLGEESPGEVYGAHHGEASIVKVRVWPPPDAVYLMNLTYFERQKELVTDNEVPLLPAQFHHVILTLAESIALSEEENHRAAAQKRAIAMEAVDNLAMEQDLDPNRIAGVGRGETSGLGARRMDGHWPRFVG